MKKKKKVKKISPARLPRKRTAKTVLNQSSTESVELFKQLGANLQSRRVDLGLTQKKFADLCGVQTATVGKVERGDLGVKLATLEKYLNLLNLRLELKEVEIV